MCLLKCHSCSIVLTEREGFTLFKLGVRPKNDTRVCQISQILMGLKVLHGTGIYLSPVSIYESKL